MRTIYILLLSSLFLSNSLFASTGITSQKNIAYIADGKASHQLDIYYPKNTSTKKDILVFIHGGSWKSGKKDSYSFFAKGFAKKNVVTIVINYRLSPEVLFDKMAEDAAAAIAWVQKNAEQYGGNPNRIFVAGHSAGGHLAALIATDRDYFENIGVTLPIKGAVLIDAFGLDMYQYFTEISPVSSSKFYPAFTSDPLNWQRGTPLNFTERTNVPFVGLVGERTYPGIILGTQRFKEKLKEENKEMQVYTMRKKKHVGMITQFFWTKNEAYKYCLDFMASIK